MAYRLSLSSSDLPAEVRRCAHEQLGDALRGLRDRRGDAATAVHEARKDLKKVRSLLRLVRPCLPEETYRAQNMRLRDIGRDLSGARDADALVETVSDFAERHVGRLPAAAFDRLRGRLAAGATSSRQRDDRPPCDRGADALEAAATAVEEWPLDACDADALREGALRAYRRGRRAMAEVTDDPTTENLHEWRKRVKDLWYHARLLEETWPRVFKAQAKEAHALADLLGDDHDLAVLAMELQPGGAAGDLAIDDALVRDLLARDRAQLQDRALRLGHQIYAERPKAFDRRLAAWLRQATRPVAVDATV
jgi:CHAD domain-containing protein